MAEQVRRLSYADPRARLGLLLYLAGLLLAVSSSLWVLHDAYTAASFYSEEGSDYVSDEVYYVDVARKYLRELAGVEMDYWRDSGKVKEDYWNFEHPPLAKYIIALSMVICGDEPLCWRVPSMAMGSLIPLVIYAGFVAAFRSPAASIAGGLAAAAAASDGVLRAASSVAMLDVYQAFFTAVSIALALNGRYALASIAGGLAAASKMSGAAAVTAAGLLWAASEYRLSRKFAALAAAASLGLLVYVATHIPLVLAFGVDKLLEETINALQWHTTSRPSGPPTSTPLGWILNSNTFYYSYGPLPLRAATNTPLHLAALAASITAILAEIAAGRRLWPGAGHIYYFSLLALYAAVMAMGNQTLYSFYAVQLTPAMAAVAGELFLAASGVRPWRR